jgi:D-arabinose 1-dehydrogenase-like Zn-dependent alcohol dehydrogenase
MNDAVRTMRAMRASSPDPVSLTSQSIPVPDPGPGELLVEVRGTAITAGELSWPESWPAIPCPTTCPEWWRRPVTGPGTGDPAH